MKSLRATFAGRFRIGANLLRFFWQQKLWWMVPLVGIVLLAGLLFLVGQQSVITPFIYVLF